MAMQPRMPIKSEEILRRRRMPPPPRMFRHGRKIDPDHEEYDLFMRHWNYSDVARVTFLAQNPEFKDNWTGISRSMRMEEDPRPSDWFTPKRCAKMYNRMLGKMQARHIYHKEQSPEEMLIQSVGQMREYHLQGEIDNAQIIACQIQSAMEMIDSGDVDRELEFLAAAVENIEKSFEGTYETWQNRLPPPTSPPKQAAISTTAKCSPTKGKASSPRSDESKRQIPASSSSSSYSGRDINLHVSSHSENIVAQVSPRAVTSPQPFFNPTSALATAAARQLAVATAAVPQGYHLTARHLESSDVNTTTTCSISTVSSVTLSAPTLSKLLEMPPSVPGKLPPLPTAFYSTLTNVPSISAQTPEVAHLQRRNAVMESTDTCKCSTETSLMSNLKGTEIIDLTSPECSVKSDGKEIADKLNVPIHSSQSDNLRNAGSQSHNTLKTVEDSRSYFKSEPKFSRISDRIKEFKVASGAQREDNFDPKAYFARNYCIGSSSDSDDSSSESNSTQPKIGTKELQKSHVLPPVRQLAGRKRSRKQIYSERESSVLDCFDSSEDGESARHVPENLHSSNSKVSDFSSAKTVSTHAKRIQRQKNDEESSNTLIFDNSNVCQSPNEAIDFLKQLDVMEKNDAASSSTITSSTFTSNPVTSVAAASSVLEGNDKEQQPSNPIYIPDLYSTVPVPSDEDSSSCDTDNRVVDDTETSSEKISVGSPEFQNAQMDSSTNRPSDSDLPLKSLDGTSPINQSINFKTVNYSPSKFLNIEVKKIVHDEERDPKLSNNENENSNISEVVQKAVFTEETDDNADKNEAEETSLKSASELHTELSEVLPKDRIANRPYNRRGRRGGRTAFAKRFFKNSSSEPYQESDVSTKAKDSSQEMSSDDALLGKDIQRQVIDSDEDTVSDRSTVELSKTRAFSRQPPRSGRRGRRGRGRAKKVPSDVSYTCKDTGDKELSDLKISESIVEQDDETRTEIEESIDNDPQKKESDSTTIEDSGASSQNSEKEFFTNNDVKDEKEFPDQRGESDTDGNDSQERKVPSESTDEADDSLMKSLSDEKPLDINDYSSTSPASTLTSEYLFSKCKEEKDDLYSRQWSPQSSAQTSQSAITPTTSDSSDVTENTDDSEETDQTANSNENSNSSKKKKKRCRKDRESQHQYKTWKKAISIIWREASYHKYANVFSQRVTDDVAPGYESIVNRPMDLSLIKKNIDNGTITTTQEFQRDMMLMFQNAIMYNSSDHDVYQMAVEMQRDVNKQIQDFLATQLIIQDKIKEASMSTYLRTARGMNTQAKPQRVSSSKGSSQQ